MRQERLIGTAKRLDKILKIVQIVSCVAVVAGVLGVFILSIASWMNPGNVNSASYVTASMGEFSIEIASAGNGIDLIYGWVNSLFLIGLMAVLCIGFRYVRKIMVPMMDGNPFAPSVSENLKKLSLLTLIYGVWGNLGSAVLTFLKMSHFQLDRLADGELILSVAPDYQLNLGFVIVYLVFLLASYIFRYGAELQQLSDETL